MKFGEILSVGWGLTKYSWERKKKINSQDVVCSSQIIFWFAENDDVDEKKICSWSCQFVK